MYRLLIRLRSIEGDGGRLQEEYHMILSDRDTGHPIGRIFLTKSFGCRYVDGGLIGNISEGEGTWKNIKKLVLVR